MALQLERAGRALGVAAPPPVLPVISSSSWMTTPLSFTVMRAFFDLLAVLGDGVGEVDVVRLPLERRQAHVDLRLELGVDAAALVVLAVEAEAVEDLHLVHVDLVEAAVAAALVAGVGAVRLQELEVDRVVVELLLGADVVAVGVEAVRLLVEPAAGERALFVPSNSTMAPSGGLGPERRTLADGALQGERLAVVGLDRQGLAADRAGIVLLAGRRELGVVAENCPARRTCSARLPSLLRG